MKQIFKGWTISLTDSEGRKYFLSVYKTAEGTRYGTAHATPLEKGVYDNLFESEENALDFWKTCYWEYFEDKSSLVSIPVKIEISVDMSLHLDLIGMESKREVNAMPAKLVYALLELTNSRILI